MEGAETLDAREYADADALVSAAAAAASAGDGTVTLTNLRVTHRKRRGAKQFWVTAAAMGHGTFEVQMSFRRADLDDAGRTGDAAMRWETEAHAAAFEAATPGAVITCAVGTLEAPRRRMQDGEVDPATRRCMWCGAASCAGSSPGGKCPAAAPVLRCGRCEWADAHAPGHVDDFHDADDVQKESPGECDAWLVFDMAFDRDMNAAEHGALSRQVSMCVAANKRARRPFRLAAISTNEEDNDAVNPNDPNDLPAGSRSKSPFVVDNADVANPAMGPNAWRRLPWTRWGARCGGPKTWQTFDASRVVYLTADADDTLDTIRDGDVLVLGGLVDHREKPGMALDRAVDYGVAPVRWRTARLPLGGHVRLLKNAHLPCLAVCQLLLLARQLTPRGDQGVAALNDALDRSVASATKKVGGKGRRGRRRKDGEEEGGAELDEKEEGGELEGGAMRGVWNAAIASCPAFRCAPLHKYVVWLPPHDALNDERRGGARARPSGVTDVRAFEFVLNGK